jgi:hypothetical protein
VPDLFDASNNSAACLSITSVPHEFFDPTGIGASFPAVSTWIAGLSQAGLISERRPSFPKAFSIEKAPGLGQGFSLYSRGQLTC